MTMTHHADIVIFGGGIAGLWLHHRLKRLGYDALLLEIDALGGGQSLASQGIIHSGIKYAFAGKINKLAQSIHAMGARWQAALDGCGDVDLRTARLATESQLLMIPRGAMGGVMKLISSKALGGAVREVDPAFLEASGFAGHVVFMDEPVLDTRSVFDALAAPYRESLRALPADYQLEEGGQRIVMGSHVIEADHVVFTAAASNHMIARDLGHDKGLKTQARPLLMAMLYDAPFALWAHLVGASDKPVASITTHTRADGSLVWYIGGGVAERAMGSDPAALIADTRKALVKYMPALDFSKARWGTVPIARIEGTSGTQGYLPDTPTVHSVGDVHYCWPTKLTFAPMLADMVLARLGVPSGLHDDWAFLDDVLVADAPWESED